jgi:hypothetical protein
LGGNGKFRREVKNHKNRKIIGSNEQRRRKKKNSKFREAGIRIRFFVFLGDLPTNSYALR